MSNAAHRRMMLDYYAARDADLLRRESVTYGYESDNALYDGHVLTFKEYLQGISGRNESDGRDDDNP